MKRFFIGIDFSKLKFDAALFDGKTTTVLDMKEFKNQESGFKAMTKWIKSMTKSDSSRWLFVENTLVYTVLHLANTWFKRSMTFGWNQV